MAKTKKVKANFMGMGSRMASDSGSGLVPGEHTSMGYYYGRGMRNPQGRIRDDTVGYRPVSKGQLGTPPKTVV
jgi:hypothetical protein